MRPRSAPRSYFPTRVLVLGLMCSMSLNDLIQSGISPIHGQQKEPGQGGGGRGQREGGEGGGEREEGREEGRERGRGEREGERERESESERER